MLSKTTVNNILAAISNLMKNFIIKEIGDQKFSVQMNGSQDKSVIDQEIIIQRYVLGEDVKERLFAVKKITDATGAGLYQLLKSELEHNGLKMEKIVGEFDRNANMRGEYHGVQLYVNNVSPNAVYMWCYAHVLNLSATNIVENILGVKNLIGLLQSTATNFGDSCKRTNIWTNIHIGQGVGSAKLKRLQKIGETRWMSLKFDAKSTFEATALHDKWCQFDVLLAAFLLREYTVLRQASEYLQTRGLDYLSAWKMVESAKQELQTISFADVHSKTTAFVKEINTLDASELDSEVKIELRVEQVH
nr:zinc finger MYM-type protein 1-like [Hydra vulgaris]